MTEETDFSSLTIGEAIFHKIWKARLLGYEELVKQFEKSKSGNDDCFQEFNEKPEILKQFVDDSNVVAKESGLHALYNFLQYGKNPVVVAKLKEVNLVDSICEKGLSSSRKITFDYSIEILLSLIEISNTADDIVAKIILWFDHKLPKLVVGCVTAVFSIIQSFGLSTISQPSIIVNKLEGLFANPDKKVRTETSNLTVELYKWMKDSIKTVLFPNLKPIQQKDLTLLFEKVEDVKVEQKRFTIIQKQKLEEKKNEISNDNTTELNELKENIEINKKIDPLTINEPVDFLSLIPNNFESQISSKKWKERKEILEDVYKILQRCADVVSTDDYSFFFKLLSRCLKDPNLQVVQLSSNCIEYLVNSLKHNFIRYTPIVLPFLIERTKEKKICVVESLNNAFYSIFKVTDLKIILDYILDGMKSKVPQVKVNSLYFLQKCLIETSVSVTLNEINNIMSISMVLLNESMVVIRAETIKLIAILLKITGQRELQSYLDSIDEIKKNKIIQTSEKIEVNSKFGPQPNTNTNTDHNQSGFKKKNLKPLKTSSSVNIISKNVKSITSIPTKRNASSPAKRSEELPKSTFYGRKLTSRSLSVTTPIVNNNQQKNISNFLKSDVEFTLEEKKELQTLRKEKKQLVIQKAKDIETISLLKEENKNFKQQITELNLKIEANTKDKNYSLLMNKQKDAQIQRLSSDLENFKLKIRDLEQTIEMIKLQQYQNQKNQKYNNNNSANLFSYKNQKNKQIQNDTEKYVLNSSELSSRVKRLSIGNEHHDYLPLNNNDLTKNNRESIESPKKSIYSLSSCIKNGLELDSSDENWKRAAEVTSQLKARIEKMKARSRIVSLQ